MKRHVYILHFDKPFHHARHYVGCTNNVGRRVSEHLHGYACGSKLVKAAMNSGIKVEVAKVFKGGDLELEKKIKAMHQTSKVCPICQNGVN